MALTYSCNANTVHGSQRAWQGTVTFDASYTTGGLTVGPAQLGMVRIDSLQATPQNGSNLVAWNPTTGKLLLYTAIATEAANASNQSTVVIGIDVVGH